MTYDPGDRVVVTGGLVESWVGLGATVLRAMLPARRGGSLYSVELDGVGDALIAGKHLVLLTQQPITQGETHR
jgi:hypothetical protein